MRYIRRGIVVLFAASVVLWLTVTVLAARGKDTAPPVITSTADEIEVSVSDGEDVLLAGLTASDNKDGDITDRIRVGTHSKFIHPGVCEVRYFVFDSSYNVGQYSRRVTYTDYESPKFTLNASLIYKVGEDVSVMSRVGAVDVLDGEIDNKIKMLTSDVNSTKEGDYSVELEVTNEYADVSDITLPVHMVSYDPNGEDRPQILLDSYLVYLEKGERFSPGSYVKEVIKADGSRGSISDVDIDNGVNTSREGVYEAAYTYESEDGKSSTVYLVAVVTE